MTEEPEIGDGAIGCNYTGDGTCGWNSRTHSTNCVAALFQDEQEWWRGPRSLCLMAAAD
jgi:hypothetical protein